MPSKTLKKYLVGFSLSLVAAMISSIFGNPSAWGAEMGFENLIRKDGVWADKVTGEPFSGRLKGTMIGLSRGCRGCKDYEGTLNYGKADGTWTYYHDNGELYQKKNYKLGILHGDFISFYRSGQLCQKGEYANGRLSGSWERYKENGQKWPPDEDRSPECDMCICND